MDPMGYTESYEGHNKATFFWVGDHPIFVPIPKFHAKRKTATIQRAA